MEDGEGVLVSLSLFEAMNGMAITDVGVMEDLF